MWLALLSVQVWLCESLMLSDFRLPVRGMGTSQACGEVQLEGLQDPAHGPPWNNLVRISSLSPAFLICLTELQVLSLSNQFSPAAPSLSPEWSSSLQAQAAVTSHQQETLSVSTELQSWPDTCSPRAASANPHPPDIPPNPCQFIFQPADGAAS